MRNCFAPSPTATRACSGRNIRGRWLSIAALAAAACAALPAVAQQPAPLTRAYRESPSPAKRAALERYAAAHASQTSGALARLALGITAYEQKDWPAAIRNLSGIEKRIPELADYAAWYGVSARLEAGETGLDPGSLKPVHATAAPSPLAARAALAEARILTAAGAPARAVRVLQERQGVLPQPDGDLALATAYDGAGDRVRAALYYQQVYYQHPLSDGAARAAAALEAMRAAMGGAFPEPAPVLQLARADKLLAARSWSRARAEYRAVAARVEGAEREIAQVRAAASDYLDGNASAAYDALRALSPGHSEAAAERLYYMAECARRLDDDSRIEDALDRLARLHPRSPWRLKALISSGNRYLLVNNPDRYVPLYAAAYESFPADPQAAYAHWKVAWNSYMGRRPDAPARMRRHLEMFPFHPSAAAALYFLGRLEENAGRLPEARACYIRLRQLYPNYYYGLQARERLQDARLAGAAPAPKAAAFLDSIAFPERPTAAAARPTAATRARMARTRLLHSAGLDELAAAEVRFGGNSGEQATLLAAELARGAAAPHEKLRLLKSVRVDYFTIPVENAPAAYWESLFPLPFRSQLVQNARRHDLDPFKVAALIRQESEFNPRAVSRARAHGLTQVMPSTGRQLAPKVGIRRFRTAMLFQPSVNLRLGTYYMRSLLDKWGGSWEETLASYNAGPNRVAEWAAWHQYREGPEFVESIPFTETREYVQAVLRNAAMYRTIYRGRDHSLKVAAP